MDFKETKKGKIFTSDIVLYPLQKKKKKNLSPLLKTHPRVWDASFHALLPLTEDPLSCQQLASLSDLVSQTHRKGYSTDLKFHYSLQCKRKWFTSSPWLLDIISANSNYITRTTFQDRKNQSTWKFDKT